MRRMKLRHPDGRIIELAWWDSDPGVEVEVDGQPVAHTARTTVYRDGGSQAMYLTVGRLRLHRKIGRPHYESLDGVKLERL